MFRLEVAGNEVSFSVRPDQSQVVACSFELGMEKKRRSQNRGAVGALRIRGDNFMRRTGRKMRAARIVLFVIQHFKKRIHPISSRAAILKNHGQTSIQLTLPSHSARESRAANYFRGAGGDASIR